MAKPRDVLSGQLWDGVLEGRLPAGVSGAEVVAALMQARLLRALDILGAGATQIAEALDVSPQSGSQYIRGTSWLRLAGVVALLARWPELLDQLPRAPEDLVPRWVAEQLGRWEAGRTLGRIQPPTGLSGLAAAAQTFCEEWSPAREHLISAPVVLVHAVLPLAVTQAGPEGVLLDQRLGGEVAPRADLVANVDGSHTAVWLRVLSSQDALDTERSIAMQTSLQEALVAASTAHVAHALLLVVFGMRCRHVVGAVLDWRPDQPLGGPVTARPTRDAPANLAHLVLETKATLVEHRVGPWTGLCVEVESRTG